MKDRYQRKHALKFRVISGLILLFFIFTAFRPKTGVTIYLIGDSTMCNYDTTNNNPQRGWGQMLSQFFNSDATIVNWAAGGRSSKSYYNESGKWDYVLSHLQAGDYVFIQFAHNDEKDPVLYPDFHTDPGSTYDQYLTAYVNEARAKGAIPVICTPICRFYYGSDGLITASGQHNVSPYGDYPAAARNVATNLSVPLIDLTVSTKSLYEAYGTANGALLHITTDNTHPNVLGATLIAQLAVQEMKSKSILTDYLTTSTNIILSPTSVSFGDLTINLTSSATGFSVSGFSLSPTSGNVVLTAPSNFEVSTSASDGFGTSVSLAYTNGTLTTTTVYARFKPTTVKTYNDSIMASINGTNLQSLKVSGQGTPVPSGLAAASATWSLLNSQAATSVSGSLSATNQTLGAYMAGIAYNTTFGTVAGWQRVATTSYLPTTYNATSYVDYKITPQPGYYFILNSVTLNALGGGSGNGKLAAYYSTDGFTTSTALGTATYYAAATPSSYAATTTTPISLLNSGSASATVQGSTSFSPSVTVKGGQTLTVRFYSWCTSASKYLTSRNVTLSGNSATASKPSAPTTATVTGIYATSATSGGSAISSDSNSVITAKGVCWNLAGSPTIGDSKTVDGAGSEAYTSSMIGLIPGLTYYVRAYATNAAGTTYGDEISFTTSSSATEPLVSTGSATNIGNDSVSVSGTISSDGGTALLYSGFCWSTTNATPTISDSKNDVGVNTGAISSKITGLTPSTTYYIRAYATNNSNLTGYGTVITFTTAGDYYNASGVDVTTAANWGTNTDGSGTHPDFTKDNQKYHLINTTSVYSQNWSVSANSKIILGNGTDSIGFTIPASYYLSGKIDLSSKTLLIVQNSTNLILGSINANSTVNYDGSSALTFVSGAYGNLASTNDAGATRALPSGTISVSKTFTKGSATYSTPVAGTFVFNGTAAQVIPGISYYNLQLNNSAGAVVNDSLILASGGTLTLTSGQLTVYGVIDNKSSNAPVTTGGLLMKTGSSYRINGGPFPTATYESNSNVYVVSGSPSLVSTIGGNLIWTSTGAAGFNITPVTIGGNFTMTAGTWAHGNGGVARTVIVQGNMYFSGGTYTIANTSTTNSTIQTLTVNGDLYFTGGTMYVSNNNVSGTNGTLNIGGNLYHTAGILGNGSSVTSNYSGKIVLNGTNAQTISTTGFTNNLNVTINNAAGVTLASDITIDATLTLTSGILSLGDHNLTMNAASSFGGTPSSASMIYQNGTGRVKRIYTTTGSFTFPIGDVSGTAEYAPVTVNASADSYTDAYISVTTTRAKHPYNASASDYINRYWTVASSGFTNGVFSGTFTYPAADVQGNESVIFGAHYYNSVWENVGVIASHSFTTPNLVTLGDFTCADGTVVPTSPVITVSKSGMAFGRVNRNTTSAEQSFNITGYYLTPADGNVTITAPENYQISLTSGSGFASTLNLPYTSSSLSATTIYVHFNAPDVTAATPYNGTLTNAGGGATQQNISLTAMSIISNADLGVNMVIAADGTGDYTTWQAAVNNIPTTHTGTYLVFVRPGFYHEKVTIPATLSNLKFMGENRDSTILDYNDYVGSSGTAGSPGTNVVQTLQINSSDVTFENLTFQNLVTVERAVAINIGNSVDKVIFRSCNIYGHQDTYYLWGCNRVYHVNCKITGSVDFIFGSGIAVFDTCQIVVNRNGGVLTAASTYSNFKYGLVFRNCSISADSIGFDSTPITGFYLGRPWNDSPKTVFLQCYEPSTLTGAGWTLMNSDPAAAVNQAALYAEYNCTGPGFKPSSRAVISGNSNYGRQLSTVEAQAYSLSNIFAAASKTDSPFANGDWFPAGAADLLPVELNSFSSNVEGRNVRLIWSTATEVNTAKFVVQRSKASADSWTNMGEVQASGNSNSMKSYYFVDKKLNPGRYNYRLQMVDNDGTFQYSPVVDAAIAAPSTFALSQNYPNPFNPSTVISYSLNADSRVIMELFSVSGEKIATLINETKAADSYDYRLDMGKLHVPSGVYFYRLSSSDISSGKTQVSVKKLVYLR